MIKDFLRKSYANNNYTKLFLVILFLMMVFVLVYIFAILPTIRDDIYNEKMIHTREMVDIGLSVLERYHELEMEGSLNEEVARDLAGQMIRSLRYGERDLDYFWINDFNYHVIIHPFRPDLEGDNVYDFKDPEGFYLFREFVELCREEGSGHTSYLWQYYDEAERFEEKLSYVSSFEPWDWIIGTGVYLSDLEAVIAHRRNIALLLALIFFAVLSGLIVIYSRDKAKIEQAENALKKLNEELEQRVAERTAELEWINKELAAFTYSVSHDLRAPLRSINGFSEVIIDDYSESLDATGLDYLQRINKASRRMNVLIEDLLKLSRVTRQELHHDRVNLSAMAEACTVYLQDIEPHRKVAFDLTPELFATGDAALLRIAIDNLFNNAWKFTKGVEDPLIEFGAKKQGNETIFYIRDNGVGFDSRGAGKIFDAFHRLHSGDDYPGSGIGLSIVQRIIERHGGKIWAESSPGKGAVFYFTL